MPKKKGKTRLKKMKAEKSMTDTGFCDIRWCLLLLNPRLSAFRQAHTCCLYFHRGSLCRASSASAAAAAAAAAALNSAAAAPASAAVSTSPAPTRDHASLGSAAPQLATSATISCCWCVMSVVAARVALVALLPPPLLACETVDASLDVIRVGLHAAAVPADAALLRAPPPQPPPFPSLARSLSSLRSKRVVASSTVLSSPAPPPGAHGEAKFLAAVVLMPTSALAAAAIRSTALLLKVRDPLSALARTWEVQITGGGGGGDLVCNMSWMKKKPVSSRNDGVSWKMKHTKKKTKALEGLLRPFRAILHRDEPCPSSHSGKNTAATDASVPLLRTEKSKYWVHPKTKTAELPRPSFQPSKMHWFSVNTGRKTTLIHAAGKTASTRHVHLHDHRTTNGQTDRQNVPGGLLAPAVA